MTPEFPIHIYLIRSKQKPQVTIMCTELHLSKWVNQILEKKEDPEVQPITLAQLKQLFSPDPQLN